MRSSPRRRSFAASSGLKCRKGGYRLLELQFVQSGGGRAGHRQGASGGCGSVSAEFPSSELLDHFGVRIKEHEEGDVFLDPSHAYIEGFPSIPADGMLATFNRQRAIVREDIRFLSADHALVQVRH